MYSMKTSFASHQLKLLSPAKINLFLHVVGRRADGYHNIQTAFQFLTLSDELLFSKSDDKKIDLTTENLDILPENNLIMRAAKLLQTQTNTQFGAHIQLNKKIPVGGGLGGGSSNAATTLVALNELWETKLSKTELAKLGLQLGADVPVFIEGHAAFGEGVGEKLTPIDPAECWCLVIVPNVQVSTQEIYCDSQLTRDTPLITIREFLEQGGHNDCEPVVRNRYPQIEAAFNWLSRFAQPKLTGTGGCLFALFKNEQEALAIHRKMTNNLRGFVTKTINQSPLYWGIAKR